MLTSSRELHLEAALGGWSMARLVLTMFISPTQEAPATWPVLPPPQNSEGSALRMESEGGSSTPLSPIATLGDSDAEPGYSSFELPNTDPGKLRELPTGPGTHGEDPAPGRPSSLDAVMDGPPDMGSMGKLSCSAKIPNRDSGIDSPSCSMASEPFPCKESGEVGLGPTVLRLHPEMAPDSKALQEEADSDVGEGSSEEPEPEPENSHPRANMDLAKVGCPLPRGSGTPSRGLRFAMALFTPAASSWEPTQAPHLERPLGQVGGQSLGRTSQARPSLPQYLIPESGFHGRTVAQGPPGWKCSQGGSAATRPSPVLEET